MAPVVIEHKRATDAKGRKVFTAEIKTSLEPEAAWAIMADTQRLNEVVFKLSTTELLSTTPDQAHARTKLGPLPVEYDELAWSFDAPLRFQSTRLFRSGPLRRLDVECAIMRAMQSRDVARVTGPSGAVVHYSAALTTGGPLGLAAEIVLLAKLESAMPRLQALLECEDAAQVATSFPPRDADAIAARARPYADAAVALHKPSASRVERLVAHLSRATENDVARLRPYALARLWKDDPSAVLALFLRAVKTGLLVMRWDILCPSCALPVDRGDEIAQLHKEGRCSSCGVAFDVNVHSNVEAAFAPPPAIRRAAAAVYCLGSPRSTPHWLSQITLAPGESWTLKQSLSPGRYRVQAAGLDAATIVDVGPTGDARAAVVLGANASVALRAGAIELDVKNPDAAVSRRAQLTHESFADDAATAAHVVALPLWRELFG